MTTLILKCLSKNGQESVGRLLKLYAVSDAASSYKYLGLTITVFQNNCTAPTHVQGCTDHADGCTDHADGRWSSQFSFQPGPIFVFMFSFIVPTIRKKQKNFFGL